MALYYDEILAGNCLGQINIIPPASSNKIIMIDKKQALTLPDEFGFSIEELFYMARQFLKEKQGSKEIQLKYGDNIRLIALSKQIKIGKWDASYTQDVGFLDVVGNDRKQAWITLGDMSKEKAMEEYVKLLLDRCGMFRTFVETQHVENEENDRLRKDDETRRTLEEEAERVRRYELEQISRLEKQKKKREEFQRKQIQDALNLQTYSQFKAYAEQQYRDNRQAQEELIRQLQEQHFQQYMQQVYQQQLLDQQQQLRTKVNMEQQSENVISSSIQPPSADMVPPPLANIVSPPSIPGNMTIPPTSLGIVHSPAPTNIVTASSPTNVVSASILTSMAPSSNTIPSAIPFLANIPLQPMSQIPPLGPAPTQLPPLAHPPPPIVSLQSLINDNGPIQEFKLEPIIPIQTQFETLALNSPLEPIPPLIPQPSIGNDLIQQQFSSAQFNNELNTTQELMDGNSIALSSFDASATVDSNGELSLVSEEGKRETPNIIPANMWTRKDIKEFKEQIRKEKDAVIKISSGETVTVRVPTHEDGQCIFWEFATDYYDLGFGLYFEWSKAQSNTVTVHVSDSSEEEENEDGNNPEKKDIEKGSGSTNKPPKPPQDEIVPIYRRDSHEEVYAGSHPYPGHGVYLLKFDNSYSLWRSKTLYYRVYYSK